MKYQVSEIYPVSEVTLGSELFYLCELGKYFAEHGDELSLNGVVLSSSLKHSRFWDYLKVANYNGWLTDIAFNEFDLMVSETLPLSMDSVVNKIFSESVISESKEVVNKRKDSDFFNKCTPVPYRVHFVRKSTENWVWSEGETAEQIMDNSSAILSSPKGRTLKGSFSSQCFLSLIAYVAVERFYKGNPQHLTIECTETYASQQHALSNVILLQESTNAIDWVDIEFRGVSEERQNQLGYEAWLYRGRDAGFPKREYSPREKGKNMKRLGMLKGDVVSLYERKISQSGNSVKSISDFHFAIIKSVTQKGVLLQKINTTKTRLEAEYEYHNLPNHVKKMYDSGHVPYKNFRSVEVFVEWNELGVEYMMGDEPMFICPLEVEDTRELFLDDKNGYRIQYTLSAPDIIYWILKDYAVEFNEEHFLSTYFKNIEPMYDRYQRENGVIDI